VAAVCEHGAECHTGAEPSMATAPEASRAWLLIEHPGPWPHDAADAALPPALAALAVSAEAFGVRVQMIRRPGRRQVGDVRTVFLGWTAGGEPFLRRARVSASSPELAERDLKELACGSVPSFGSWWPEPLFLVCTHGKRSVCCARFGGPLAQALAARHPGQVWETTHVGGVSRRLHQDRPQERGGFAARPAGGTTAALVNPRLYVGVVVHVVAVGHLRRPAVPAPVVRG
jgi:hypothetical protein